MFMYVHKLDANYDQLCIFHVLSIASMLVQGVRNALRAWRAASSGGQVETGASTEIGPQMLGTPFKPAVNDFNDFLEPNIFYHEKH